MMILITKFKVTSRWSLFWIFRNNRTLEVNSKIVEGNYKRHNYYQKTLPSFTHFRAVLSSYLLAHKKYRRVNSALW